MNKSDKIMKKEELTSRDGVSFRQKAERQYKRKSSIKMASYSEAETMKVIHELEVHQIELEMQYEELKRAERKAELATEKFTTLYDFAPVGYFILDRNCKIIELNISGAIMLQRERAVLVKSNFRQFLTHDTFPLFDDFFMKIFENQSKQICEVRLNLYGDFTILVHVEGIISAVDNMALITLTDITRHDLIEKKLQNSETRYRRLFETAKDGILILDAYNGQIVDVNPFLIDILGYSYEEFLGKELWEIGIFKNIEDSKAAFIELQNKGYIRFEDKPLETKSGKPISVEYVSNVYMVDDAKVIQCNIREITERKIAEAHLKESEARLLELNATKDKFFSIIAHDLKSPFTSIIGLSDLLAEQVGKKDYEGIDEYANMIQSSSWHAMDLLTNLMEWSRSQTGRMEFNPANINLSGLINEVIELLNDSAKHKYITISEDIPADLSLFADRLMLNTVLRNLVSNAVKYTNIGGTIRISAVLREKELEMAVKDNGIGIKTETLEKLFHIEESISTPGTQDENGTGLGLILCKDFVLKHGGKIWAESEPGNGSRFVFTIPV
jgi:PAS domain S-box-containing protein